MCPCEHPPEMRVTRRSISLLAILLSFAALAGRAEAQPREPIRYTFRVIDAAKHIAEVDARFPSSGQSSLDLMMPPGFYRVEDYAARVQSLVARTPGELDYGEMLGWYGLRFAGGPGTTGDHSWSLEVRPRATAAQRRHVADLLAPPSRTR